MDSTATKRRGGRPLIVFIIVYTHPPPCHGVVRSGRRACHTDRYVLTIAFWTQRFVDYGHTALNYADVFFLDAAFLVVDFFLPVFREVFLD